MVNTDTLFAPVDPLQRALPFNPPADVVIMDYASFERTLKAPLLAHAPQASSSSFVGTRTPPATGQ